MYYKWKKVDGDFRLQVDREEAFKKGNICYLHLILALPSSGVSFIHGVLLDSPGLSINSDSILTSFNLKFLNSSSLVEVDNRSDILGWLVVG